MKNEKKSSKTNCSKILDQILVTSSINYRSTSKHSLAEKQRFSRGFNHTRFNRNVILKSIVKTIEDPLEIGKNELNVSLFLRAYKGHCYWKFFINFHHNVNLTPPFKFWTVLVAVLENLDDLGKSFCVVMYSIVTVIQHKRNRIEISTDNV